MHDLASWVPHVMALHGDMHSWGHTLDAGTGVRAIARSVEGATAAPQVACFAHCVATALDAAVIAVRV